MFNGFYKSLQNTWKQRLLRKPTIISEKLAGYGYGKVTQPFYIDYGNIPSNKIESIDVLDSRYMYGSENEIQYVSDITTASEGGTDSGF